MRRAGRLVRRADGDRNAELSNANKSFADRRVTGDPPCSSPTRRATSTQILESTNNHQPYFIKHRTGFFLLGFISDVRRAGRLVRRAGRASFAVTSNDVPHCFVAPPAVYHSRSAWMMCRTALWRRRPCIIRGQLG
jgi:hypothetical protein